MPKRILGGAPQREPEAPWPEAPRLCPGVPLPAYRFVPGLNPHPTEDPAGHSYGLPHRSARLDPERWRENESYLFGIDLYHQGYYWEAHEAWEGLWREAGRHSTAGTFLQGLILNSAAQLKAHSGAARGARILSRSSAARLERLLASGSCDRDGSFMGLGVPALLDGLRAHYRPLWEDADDAAVRLQGRPPLLLPIGVELQPR